MAQYCDNFTFQDTSDDSFQFWNGLRGPAGEPGTSVQLRGPVASTDDLPVLAPSDELWLVGAASPYDGWFYNGSSWENAGPIAQGPPGETGATPDFSIGTVTTGAAGSSAAASITGTPEEPVLNLTIPRGNTGAAGQNGQNGQNGADGADGYSPTVAVTPITDGHQVAITDKNGTTTFDVMDGNDGTGIRRNLLDNAYFVGGGSQLGDGVFPINQRGQTSYSSNGYTIDRWTGSSAVTLNVTQNGITLADSVDGVRGFSGQPLDIDVKAGYTYIFTILYDTLTVTSNATLSLQITYSVSGGTSQGANSDYVTTQSGILSAVLTAAQDCKITKVNIIKRGATGTMSLRVIAAKLELGDTQTLAHQENGVWVLNEIPNYSTELAKCQAYYIKLGLYPRFRAAGVYQNSIMFFVPTPVSMSNVSNLSIEGTPAVELLNGTVQSDFTFDPLAAQYDNLRNTGIMVVASKTSHGLADATLRAAGMAFSTGP